MIPPIKKLQRYLSELKLHGLLVPKMDPHRCEFTLARDNYLQFVTGFSGSAGFAVVLLDSAALFVDGRYRLQVNSEVDAIYFSRFEYTYKEICNWIQHNMRSNQILAYDPLLFSESEIETFKTCCQAAEINLIEVERNPIDHIWHNRPKAEKPLLEIHPLNYSGEMYEEKIHKVCKIIKRSKAHGLFLNTPEVIAWLLNIRCSKRPYSPAALCYFYLAANQEGILFIDGKQVSNSVRSHLGQMITIKPYQEAFAYLYEIAPEALIMMDPTEIPSKAINIIQRRNGHILRQTNPCQILKACKNAVEIQGACNAHIRDGTAVVNLLAWLYQVGLQWGVSELEIVKQLYHFREQQPLFMGNSFETIVGSGPNGALIHYRATEATSRTLRTEELLLLDSGGQYLDGTTDITRTVSLNGNPTDEQKDRFTRVLKGHIAIAKAIFPAGTTGSQLDALARQFLWKIGCDYAHGTGHGVGSYLSVHEGPQSITSRPNSTPLIPGMILSNEPGYYKDNEYGIRIESLVLVKKVDDPTYEFTMYGFDTLSAVPIDLSLINVTMLTHEEREWVNQYHKWVRETLMPHVHRETGLWLAAATREI